MNFRCLYFLGMNNEYIFMIWSVLTLMCNFGVILIEFDDVLKTQNEEFHRKTGYIHFGQFEIFEI